MFRLCGEDAENAEDAEECKSVGIVNADDDGATTIVHAIMRQLPLCHSHFMGDVCV